MAGKARPYHPPQQQRQEILCRPGQDRLVGILDGKSKLFIDTKAAQKPIEVANYFLK